jgi:hypothetical protein
MNIADVLELAKCCPQYPFRADRLASDDDQREQDIEEEDSSQNATVGKSKFASSAYSRTSKANLTA